MNRTVLFILFALGVCLTAKAEPPVGVTPTVIGRATYPAFTVQAADARALVFVRGAGTVDIVVRTHD